MKKLFSIILATMLMVSVAFTLNVSAAENPHIKYLQDKLIIVGDENGDLGLDKNITRDQLAKIVVYAIGKQDVADGLINVPSEFGDMKVGGWANGYVNVAASEKIVQGFPDHTFKPHNNVTYEQAIKMVVVTSLGRDLNDEERAIDASSWAAPYIIQAKALGILQNVGNVNYKDMAVREKVFEMLYEVITKKTNKAEKTLRVMVTEERVDGAKVLALADTDTIKMGQYLNFKFANNINPKDLIGRVTDVTIGPENTIIGAKVAGEYKLLTGKFEILNKRLYMNGNKSGYDIGFDEKSMMDNLLGLYHNDTAYDLDMFLKEKIVPEYAQVLVNDNHVMFIRSYNFKDIAPVADVKGGKVYILDNQKPDSLTEQPLNSVYRVEKDGLKSVNASNISVDTVLHIYGNNNAIVTDKSLDDVNFKIEKKDGVLNFNVGGDLYALNTEKNKVGVISVDLQSYKAIPNNENDTTLRAMSSKKNVILLDINDNVQLVRGNFAQKEETMIVEKLSANAVRLIDLKNNAIDVEDTLDLEIRDGKKFIKMSELKEGDVVYVFTKDGQVSQINRYANIKNVKYVDKTNGDYLIDTNPSRGRYALVTIGGQVYELTNDTAVAVKRDNSYTFTTIDYVKEHATKDALGVAFVSTKEFKELVPQAATPTTARADLLKAIVFTNFKENVPVDSSEIVEMDYGFILNTDKVLSVKLADGSKKEYVPHPAAIIEELNPMDIVKLNLTKDGQVIGAEKIIPKDYREYEITSISKKDGVTTIELKRGTETFTKTLKRDIVIFGGDIEVGSVIRMHVIKDDIDALIIVK